MTDEEILKQADELKAEARCLLYTEGIVHFIQHMGQTEAIGSYAMDLMTWPDVDIIVMPPDVKDVAAWFRLGSGLAGRFNCFKMSFDNTFLHEHPGLPDGLYWGARINHGGRAWKVDIWGLDKEQYQKQIATRDRLQQKLAGVDRLDVLRVKNKVCRRPEYRKTITSMDVYEAATGSGVRTVEEFDAWLDGRSQLNVES